MPSLFKPIFVRLCLAFAGFMAGVVAVPRATADPITWTLNASFSGGGSATGSFVYDAATNTYSSIDITVSGVGSPFDGTYTAIGPPAGPNNPFALDFLVTALVPDFTGFTLASFDFSSALTDAGGTIPLTGNLNPFETCLDPTCSSIDVTLGHIESGTVSGVGITPEPSSLLLLGTGLLGMLGAVRRKLIS